MVKISEKRFVSPSHARCLSIFVRCRSVYICIWGLFLLSPLCCLQAWHMAWLDMYPHLSHLPRTCYVTVVLSEFGPLLRGIYLVRSTADRLVVLADVISASSASDSASSLSCFSIAAISPGPPWPA